MQPIDYRIAVRDPVQMALAGYQQGQQFKTQQVQAQRDTAMYDMQMAQFEAQKQQLEQQKMRQTEIQGVMADLASRIQQGGVGAEEIVSIGLQFPEIAEQVNSAYNTLSEAQRQGSIKELSRYAVALSRSPEIAMQLLDERIAAAEEGGMVDEVAQLKALKGQAAIDPSAPLTAIMLQLGTIMEPAQFKNFVEVAMPKSPEAASAEGKVLQDYRNGLYGPVGSPEAQATAQEAITRLSKPAVAVNVGGAEQSAFEKKLGEGQGQQVLDVMESGRKARSNLNTLGLLETELADSPAGWEAGIKSFAGGLGIETEGLSSIQAAQALISRLVPEQRAPGSGPMSDKDLEEFKKSLPSLIQTAEGRQKIIKNIRAINEYVIREANLATQVANGEIDMRTYREKLNALGNPLAEFSGGGIPTVTTDEQFDALPSGAVFIDDEGVRRRKP